MAFVVIIACGDDDRRVERVDDGVQTYREVDEVLAEPARFLKLRRVRVHGFVAAGTIEVSRDEQRFMLEHRGRTLRVRHRGLLPEIFRDGIEAVVTGRLERAADGELELRALKDRDGVIARLPPFP